ncbi:MAG TPA: hypothetical protein VK203_23025 [Nostocaceae cyanobacterium]|nr:hypothetical protein [Nostocaceae cyanobacterium]
MKKAFFVKIATIILCFLASVGIVTASFLLKKATGNNREVQIITDTSRYSEIRQQLWTDKTQIEYFPLEIPADAQSVHLAYSTGIKHSNSFLQIRLKQPPEKINKLLSDYRKIAQRQYRGGDTNDHLNLPNGVPTTFFYTSNSEAESFPPSYEILVLKAQDRGQANFKWNHGESYGVAIDIAASEIVYWAEKW